MVKNITTLTPENGFFVQMLTSDEYASNSLYLTVYNVVLCGTIRGIFLWEIAFP